MSVENKPGKLNPLIEKIEDNNTVQKIALAGTSMAILNVGNALITNHELPWEQAYFSVGFGLTSLAIATAIWLQNCYQEELDELNNKKP